ncbi:MAG: EAL domain-containing protein, partial [Acidimicrobiia bacterium]|nr:EAL domain-containing protein [Acidimicrobiia bacterium]
SRISSDALVEHRAEASLGATTLLVSSVREALIIKEGNTEGIFADSEVDTAVTAIEDATDVFEARVADLITATQTNASVDGEEIVAARDDVVAASAAMVDLLSNDASTVELQAAEAELGSSTGVYVDTAASIRNDREESIDGVADNYHIVATAALYILLIFIPASVLFLFWRRMQLHQRQANLAAALVRERDLSDRKDAFLAAASHHIKTPLSAVVGFGELLRDPSAHFSAAARRDMIEQLTDQANETSYVVDDLLAAARKDFDELHIEDEDVDLRTIIDETAAGWGEDYTVRLVVNGSGVASADARICRHIIRNLLRNAASFAKSEITVDLGNRFRNVILTISDDGDGIPEEIEDRIFNPYFSVRQDGLAPSLGLGLSVARQLARAMGGDLTHSRFNGKTQFELSLVRSSVSVLAVPALLIDPEEGRPGIESLLDLAKDGPNVVYQPILSLGSDSVLDPIAGYEALARFPWGTPPEWFKSARRLGMTVDLDLTCIKAAVAQFEPPEGDSKSFLALNINDATILSSRLPETLEGVDPGRLILELSEDALVKSYRSTTAAIDALRDRGIRLAI